MTWGASKHTLVTLKQWLEQLPVDVMHARPQLCLASALLLFQVAPYSLLEGWLDVAEGTLTAVLSMQTDEDSLSSMSIQENLFGAVIGLRAVLRKYEGDGQAALKLSQRALTLVSPENLAVRAQIVLGQAGVFSGTSLNDAVTAVETGLQAISLAQATGQSGLIIIAMGSTAIDMIGTGQLHKACRLTQQAIELGKQSEEHMLPEVGLSTALQALILCVWNELDGALALAEEAISLCQQGESLASLTYVAHAYAILLHISLSRGNLEVARTTFQEFERIGIQMNQPLYLEVCSHFITIDQVRLWLACDELDRAMRWVEELDIGERHGTPFAHEREEMARVRLLLAMSQPDLALQRLEPVLQRATAGQRWGHMIEIRLLQALAYQMSQKETQALDALSEALRLAEPEGYIRSLKEFRWLLYSPGCEKSNAKLGQPPT